MKWKIPQTAQQIMVKFSGEKFSCCFKLFAVSTPQFLSTSSGRRGIMWATINISIFSC